MSSRPNPKRFRKTVGFRLTAWYSGIFILSSVFLFSFSYFYISSSLKKQAQEAIASRLSELSALYQTGGIEAIEREVTGYKKFERKDPFLIRISGPQNETFLLILPSQWMEFDVRELQDIASGSSITWTYLRGGNGKDSLEVASIRLSDDYVLQVGKSIEDRERILSHFRRNFLVIAALLIAFAFAGGAFLAFRALRPIRHIISAVRLASSGRMDTRVPSTDTDDELGELVTLFNQMLKRIETLIEGMRDSLDNVAHDLRTPMTRFRGIAEMALRSDKDPNVCREALTECIEESERILRMLNTLMDISEAEMGAMKLHLERVNVCNIVEDIVDAYIYVAEDRGIAVHTRFGKDLWVVADSTRIYQIMSNLLENALKYTPRGGRIDMEAKSRDNEIVITVKDTGMGIYEEELPKIWDRSYRGDQSRSQAGLGLGLSLVKAIVQAHKGHVGVSSQPGKGSTFTIALPVTD